MSLSLKTNFIYIIKEEISMGVFANSALRESYGYAPDVLRNVSVRKFDEDATIMESCMQAMLESECEWRDIISEMAAREYSVLESTGREMVWEAADIRGFFNKVKEWFKKLWEKIAGLFSKFIGALASKVSSDSAFASKYKDDYNKYITYAKDINMKWYEFKNVEQDPYLSFSAVAVDAGNDYYSKFESYLIAGFKASSNKIQVVDKLKEQIKYFKDKEKDTRDSYRGAIVKKIDSTFSNGSVSSSNFVTEVKKAFRGEEHSTFKPATDAPNNIMDAIKTTNNEKTIAKANYDKLKANINSVIALIDKADKATVKSTDEDYLRSQIASIVCGELKYVGALFQTVNGIHLSCLNERRSMYKAMVVKTIASGRKAANKNESYSYDTENLDAMFDF